MGLLPIIFSTLSIFTALVIVTLLVSFIIYKIKSPKKKPYMEARPVPAAVPVYVQKVSNEPVRKEPAVYHHEMVKKVYQPQQHSNNITRFQVLNTQQMTIPAGISYYR